MLKFILFGIGFVFLFEGLIYFLFAKKIKNMFRVINYMDSDKIKSFATILILLGACIIYFTFRFYEFK